jgi:hypothetical protein
MEECFGLRIGKQPGSTAQVSYLPSGEPRWGRGEAHLNESRWCVVSEGANLAYATYLRMLGIRVLKPTSSTDLAI